MIIYPISDKPHSPRVASAGFTMVEMITVLFVFMALMGLSAAAYLTFRRDMAVRGASGQVLGMVQAAHNSALGSRQRAFVVEQNIYKGEELIESKVSSFSFRPVGLWHFDDTENIANGNTQGYGGTISISGCVPAQGRIGSGLSIEGSTLTCPFDPNFATPEGIAGSIWVWLERSEEVSSLVEDCTLIELAGAYRFYVEQGRLALMIGANNVLSNTGGEEFYLLPERWIQLSFSYDVYTRQMAIFVDRTLRGTFDVPDEFFIPDSTSDLIIASGLKGRIDEVKLLGVLEADSFYLPGGLMFSISKALVGVVPYVRLYESGENKTYIKVTTFDERGWLDAIHSGIATIKFYNGTDPTRDEQTRIFTINRQGMVEAESPGATPPSATPTPGN